MNTGNIISTDDPRIKPKPDTNYPCLIQPSPGSWGWQISDPLSDPRITHWLDVDLPAPPPKV